MALKKLEQEQKEVASRIAQIEESIRKIELQRAQNAKEQNEALAKLEEERKPILERRNGARAAIPWMTIFLYTSLRAGWSASISPARKRVGLAA